jgi:hypothetical protein
MKHREFLKSLVITVAAIYGFRPKAPEVLEEHPLVCTGVDVDTKTVTFDSFFKDQYASRIEQFIPSKTVLQDDFSPSIWRTGAEFEVKFIDDTIEEKNGDR